ncbi:MAG: hypothetical protein ABL949_15925 [Fimbriimonadaceae bacterium]
MTERRGPEYITHEEWVRLDAIRRKQANRTKSLVAVATLAALVLTFAYPISKRLETIKQLAQVLQSAEQTRTTVALLKPDGTAFETRADEDNLTDGRRIELKDGDIILTFDGKTKSRREISTNLIQTVEDMTETFSRSPRTMLGNSLKTRSTWLGAAKCRFNADGSFEYDRRNFHFLVRAGTGDTIAFVRVSTQYDDQQLPLAEWTIHRADADPSRFRQPVPATARVVDANPDELEPIQSFPRHLRLLDFQVNEDGDTFILDRYREACSYHLPDTEDRYRSVPRIMDKLMPDGSTIALRMGMRMRLKELTWPINLDITARAAGTIDIAKFKKSLAKPTCLLLPDWAFQEISDLTYTDFSIRTATYAGAEADTGLAPMFVGRQSNPVVDPKAGVENYHRLLAYSTLVDRMNYTDNDRILYALYRCYKALGATDNALRAAREGLNRKSKDPFFVQVFSDAVAELEAS